MIDLKLTNQEVIDKDRALEEAGSISGAGQFAMNVALNRFVCKDIITALAELQEKPEAYKEFEKAMQKVNEEFGDVQVVGNQQILTVPNEKLEAYNKKADALKKKHKKVIDARVEQMRQYEEETLKAPANSGNALSFHPLPAVLPEQLTGNTIFALIELVEQPDAEEKAEEEKPKK